MTLFKNKKSEINKLTFHLKILIEKQTKSKARRINNTAEIGKRENRKLNENKTQFYEKINKN